MYFPVFLVEVKVLTPLCCFKVHTENSGIWPVSMCTSCHSSHGCSGKSVLLTRVPHCTMMDLLNLLLIYLKFRIFWETSPLPQSAPVPGNCHSISPLSVFLLVCIHCTRRCVTQGHFRTVSNVYWNIPPHSPHLPFLLPILLIGLPCPHSCATIPMPYHRPLCISIKHMILCLPIKIQEPPNQRF